MLILSINTRRLYKDVISTAASYNTYEVAARAQHPQVLGDRHQDPLGQYQHAYGLLDDGLAREVRNGRHVTCKHVYTCINLEGPTIENRSWVAHLMTGSNGWSHIKECLISRQIFIDIQEHSKVLNGGK